MHYQVRKIFRWEAAHRLIDGYSGNCRNIHGHSFIAEVALESDDLDRYGFVFDFNDFSPLKRWIESNFDHAALVNVRDEEWLRFLRDGGYPHFVFSGNPTSENIARVIASAAEEVLNLREGVRVAEVIVHETCSGRAAWRP